MQFAGDMLNPIVSIGEVELPTNQVHSPDN